MARRPEEIADLVEREFERVRDPVVLDGMRAAVVPPTCADIPWDYGAPGQAYPYWTVMRDTQPGSPMTILYCEEGFGPGSPWGLGSDDQISMGMDCEWYPTLEWAYLESVLPFDLPIWEVVRREDDGTRTVVATSLTDEEAWALAYRLDGLGTPQEARARMRDDPHVERRHGVSPRGHGDDR